MRPYAPTSWAALPTCCRPPRATRACSSISIRRRRWAPTRSRGINRTRGLNENLAREILELHTLGVRTVYTQDDVISFAKVLTGWTFLPAGDNPEHGGEFSFNRRLHEPGPQTVVGKVYEDIGVEQGRAVLRDLAAHEATAKHIATKLVRYFVADEPRRHWSTSWRPPSATRAVTSRRSPRPSCPRPRPGPSPRAKLKRPSEWVISMVRAARHDGRPRPLHRRPGDPRRALVAAAVAAGLRRR